MISHPGHKDPSSATEMKTAIISLGSNIDPDTNIPRAISLLSKSLHVLKQSTFLKTKPIGFRKQPDFTNGAVLIQTSLGKKKLRELLKTIEKKQGRVHLNNKSGPRTIDLDILAWDGKVIDPDFHTRPFLRQAASELIPDLISHP